MEELIDDAIILRIGLFHESDLWIRMLCRSHGLFTAFAFGGARSKKRFCGCLDLLNSLRCRIQPTRRGAYLTLREAVFLSGPKKLRQNWKNMGIAANCMRFLEAMQIAGDSSPPCFEALENLRETLESCKFRSSYLPVFFRLKIASLAGFSPNLESCGKCGQPIRGIAFFYPAEGQMLCEQCKNSFQARPGGQFDLVNENSLLLLRSIKNELPSNWAMLEATTEDARQSARLVDHFIEYHVGLKWNNGFFQRV